MLFILAGPLDLIKDDLSFGFWSWAPHSESHLSELTGAILAAEWDNIRAKRKRPCAVVGPLAFLSARIEDSIARVRVGFLSSKS